ncbi:BLUF domain-containing protein [Rhodoferax sp. PAMC 29310]|uniref:BLUF domain-containing protein n=1 Tax=Rhodoferax sp. PAMC 29310 TaxID=2822760 RepID=UPI001F0B1DF4|nr:BLUF domain-containing protein [Rhodoferax sp. PAMC 29310]
MLIATTAVGLTTLLGPAMFQGISNVDTANVCKPHLTHSWPWRCQGILGASQRNNLRAGITGALCLSNGIFLQQLEGDRAAVNELYHRLLGDKRHHGTAVLDFGEIPYRRFAS